MMILSLRQAVLEHVPVEERAEVLRELDLLSNLLGPTVDLYRYGQTYQMTVRPGWESGTNSHLEERLVTFRQAAEAYLTGERVVQPHSFGPGIDHLHGQVLREVNDSSLGPLLRLLRAYLPETYLPAVLTQLLELQRQLSDAHYFIVD